MLAKLMLKCKLKYAGNGIKAKITGELQGERMSRSPPLSISVIEFCSFLSKY